MINFKGGCSMADPTYAAVRKDLMAELGKHWGLLLALGILAVLVGIIAVVWPDKTLLVVALLFGANVFVTGIFQLVGAFSAAEASGGQRALLAVIGVLGIVVGIFLMRNIFDAVVVLAVLVGIFWIMNAIGDLFVGFSAEAEGRGWRIASGILGLIAGVIVLVWPAPTIAVLTWVMGIWLVIYGIIAIVGAFKLRGVANRVAGAPATSQSGSA
jgi:uncharacterized membrane protein HdeD (DUF308 family)